MPITPHFGHLSASADVRVCVMGFVDDFERVLFSVVVPLRSALGFSGRSRAGHINSMVFRLCFLLFLSVLTVRCAFYVLFSIFAVRWSVVCGSIVRVLFRRCVKQHV